MVQRSGAGRAVTAAADIARSLGSVSEMIWANSSAMVLSMRDLSIMPINIAHNVSATGRDQWHFSELSCERIRDQVGIRRLADATSGQCRLMFFCISCDRMTRSEIAQIVCEMLLTSGYVMLGGTKLFTMLCLQRRTVFLLRISSFLRHNVCEENRVVEC